MGTEGSRLAWAALAFVLLAGCSGDPASEAPGSAESTAAASSAFDQPKVTPSAGPAPKVSTDDPPQAFQDEPLATGGGGSAYAVGDLIVGDLRFDQTGFDNSFQPKAIDGRTGEFRWTAGLESGSIPTYSRDRGVDPILIDGDHAVYHYAMQSADQQITITAVDVASGETNWLIELPKDQFGVGTNVYDVSADTILLVGSVPNDFVAAMVPETGQVRWRRDNFSVGASSELVVVGREQATVDTPVVALDAQTGTQTFMSPAEMLNSEPSFAAGSTFAVTGATEEGDAFTQVVDSRTGGLLATYDYGLDGNCDDHLLTMVACRSWGPAITTFDPQTGAVLATVPFDVSRAYDTIAVTDRYIYAGDPSAGYVFDAATGEAVGSDLNFGPFTVGNGFALADDLSVISLHVTA